MSHKPKWKVEYFIPIIGFVLLSLSDDDLYGDFNEYGNRKYSSLAYAVAGCNILYAVVGAPLLGYLT